MPSIFTKIINGEIPCHKIDENEEFLAFLDIMPIAIGHTLVIPKIEIDYMYDLEDDHLGRLHIFAKKVAKKIKSSIPCKRIGTAVIGLEVPHAHLHLIPLNSVTDINFEKSKLILSEAELTQIAKRITNL